MRQRLVHAPDVVGEVGAADAQGGEYMGFGHAASVANSAGKSAGG
jgi:hypothetical protein